MPNSWHRLCSLFRAKENAMTRFFILLLLGLFTMGGVVGCEVDGDVDDDGAKLEIDVDD
jgi:hypothetical protein